MNEELNNENIIYFNNLDDTLKKILITKLSNCKIAVKQYKEILTKIEKENENSEEFSEILLQKRKIERLRINAKKIYNRGNIVSLKTHDLNQINSDLYLLIEKLEICKSKYEELKSKIFYKNKKEKLKELEKLIIEYDSKIKSILEHSYKYEINKTIIAMQQSDNRKKRLEETLLFLELKIYNLALEIYDLLKDKEEILEQIKENEGIDFKKIVNLVDEDVESIFVFSDKIIK